MVDIPKFEGAEEGPELASAIVPPASPQIPQDAPGEDLPLPPPRPPRKVGFVDLEPSVRLDASAAPPKGFVVTPGQADIDQGSDAPGRPAWSSTLGAAFRQDNTVGAFFANEMNDAPTTVDPTFNTWEAIRGTKYEDRWDSFINDRNPRAVELRKQKIDREEEDRKLFAAAPWWQSVPSQMAAGVFDLPTLLPGGAFVRGAKGGFSIARTALNVAGAAAVSSGVQEAALQGLTETRTAGESAINIGASAVIGGLLGMAGAKLLSPGEWKAAVEAVENNIAGIPSSPGSVGAAANVATPIEQNTIAGKAAQVVAGATEQLNPALRLLQSESPTTRDVGTQLFENSLYLKKNFEGVASQPAVETLMKEWNAGLARAITSSGDSYSEFRKAGGQMSQTEFQEAIGKAMRRGDQSDDPHVTKAAQTWRAQVFDPMKQAAIDAGLLPKDVSTETAISYFSRMWNRSQLIAREGEFKGIVERWVTDNMPGWAQAFDKSAERRLEPLRLEIRDLETDKLRRASRAQEEGTDIGDISEDAVRQALRIVQGGATKPKGVDTLTQFVAKAGGLVEHQGELANRGISNKVRPGFVRAERRRGNGAGGWDVDDMARHAWEAGYFPHLTERPSMDEFLEALSDDFHKMRAVVRHADRDAYRLNDLVEQLEADLNRLGVKSDGPAPKFSTADELKGMADRMRAAIDAETDRRIAELKDTLAEREAASRMDRDSRFLDDPKNLSKSIADEVFNKLTGKTGEGPRPEFITVKARGPLKERTFNIPDELVESFLESNAELVGRRYARVMGADIETKNKFGSLDLEDQLQKIRDDYAKLRAAAKDEKARLKLDAEEKADLRDIKALRDLLRGTRQEAELERGYGRIVRAFNHVNYIRSMGEVVLASLTDVMRPAMVHGLTPYMGSLKHLATNLEAVKLSVKEAQLAGNVLERVLGHRLATVSDIMDPYAARSPIERFLENMTNVASHWNGIRIWTDGMKSMTAVMTQNRILKGATGFDKIKAGEKAYLAYLGVDQDMATRIVRQFEAHGETLDGVRVANTEDWTDAVARRTYRAAVNKDMDSIIVQKSVADIPLFASTPTGKALLQFKSFALASHQKILLRGLQEDQARFLGGVVAMTLMGMFITYIKTWFGNRPDQRTKMAANPGWWIGEGLDRSGIFAVPMEFANAFEKGAGVNAFKTPLKAFDQQGSISQRIQNRNEIGSFFGPTAGLGQDALTVMGIPKRLVQGQDVSKGQWTAAERLLPFNSYYGMRQIIRYTVNPPG